ncbi:MAG: NAD(P)H-dependent oxidoreductase subunit E [Anaerolineales bacterium]|nr:NAD(P)H-dependent oxidoreductase subunit E [Anaerolineales bacterium]MCZ2123336.1 NAD(P)H-dependent oxidoreductase subunit E [Anaerolineales bacterium]
MSLEKTYPKEVKQILAKYPPEGKRSAVMPLLFLAQREEGYITKAAIEDIAQLLDITTTEIDAVITFYTLYHQEKAGKYRVQVCNDLPCALRGADKFLEDLCENLAIKVGETTPDGAITLEAVACLAACNNAPMFQTQGPDGIKYYENMTVAKTMDVIQTLKHAGKEAE